jgi:hypothetical protein
VDTSTTITATPNTGFLLDGFYKNPNLTTKVSQPGQQTLSVTETANTTYTAKFLPHSVGPGQCTPPLQLERFVSATCPSGTTGTARQRQIRTYTASAPGPGECPATEWQNTGTPDYSGCATTQRWRNCITGQFVDGTPPSNFVQVTFTGAGGGTCWEPQGDIGFLPSLTEALRFTYQRGSSTLPASRIVEVSNTSNSQSQRITMTTNAGVRFTVGNTTGAGTVSFIVPPKASVRLSVSVTVELLQELQDGNSVLALDVQYQPVV